MSGAVVSGHRQTRLLTLVLAAVISGLTVAALVRASRQDDGPVWRGVVVFGIEQAFFFTCSQVPSDFSNAADVADEPDEPLIELVTYLRHGAVVVSFRGERRTAPEGSAGFGFEALRDQVTIKRLLSVAPGDTCWGRTNLR